MGELLTDLDELLFRQVHPSFIHDGALSSQPFQPTPKDENRLSVDRSSLTDPASSFAKFIAAGHESAAVYGLTVGEFSLEVLPCVSDPLAATATISENPAHAYVDYSAHGSNQQKIKAKRLKRKAVERGRLHP